MRDGIVDRALGAFEVGVVRLPASRLGERVEPATRARRGDSLRVPDREAEVDAEADTAAAFVCRALQQRECGALPLLLLPRACARRREVLADVIGRRLVRHLGNARRRRRNRTRVRPDQLLRQMLRVIY